MDPFFVTLLTVVSLGFGLLIVLGTAQCRAMNARLRHLAGRPTRLITPPAVNELPFSGATA